MLNEIFDLFVMLDATDEQLEFPVLYAVAKEGVAGRELNNMDEDLSSLMDTIIDHVPPPDQPMDVPFKMLISSIDWNDYVGRIAVGRIEQGIVKVNQDLSFCHQA